MSTLETMADKLNQAHKLIIDARVAGAISNDPEAYSMSLLIGALEKHVGVLQVHIDIESRRIKKDAQK